MKRQPVKQWEQTLYTVLHDFVYILAVITILFLCVVRVVSVSGASMQPTLQEGERVLLRSNLISGRYRQGDIVVATIPGYDAEKSIIKRVIATEGQQVDIDFETGEVRIDGELLQEPYIKELTMTNFEHGLEYPVTVPEGCVFLMGDNRNNSTDSRCADIGCVKTADILGKVIMRPVN